MSDAVEAPASALPDGQSRASRFNNLFGGSQRHGTFIRESNASVDGDESFSKKSRRLDRFMAYFHVGHNRSTILERISEDRSSELDQTASRRSRFERFQNFFQVGNHRHAAAARDSSASPTTLHQGAPPQAQAQLGAPRQVARRLDAHFEAVA